MLKIKFILRWGTILIISFVYYISLVVSCQKFEAFIKSKELTTAPATLNEYYNSVDTIALASDITLTVSIYGFPIALLLSLLAFKKIR